MASSRCLFNASASAALGRVFLPPTLERSAASGSFQIPRIFAPSFSSHDTPPRRQSATTTATQIRTFTVRRTGVGPDNNAPTKAKLARLPRDQEITHPFVFVRPRGGGRLGAARPTREVLASLDLKVDSLRVLAMPDPKAAANSDPNDSSSSAPQWPVCTIVNRKQEQMDEWARKKEARKRGVNTKELEINWAIDPHDLEHRLRKLRGFLEKGARVEIALLSKARKRKATKEEARETLRKVMEAVEEVKGSKEVKPQDGQVGGTTRLYYEGPQGGVNEADA